MSYKKFTKDVGLVIFTNIILALRGIILLPIITKMLGVESYGVWAQITVLSTLLFPLATLLRWE